MENQGQHPALLSPSDIAREAGCNPETVRNWEKAGEIPPAQRVGLRRDRVWRFDQVADKIAAYRAQTERRCGQVSQANPAPTPHAHDGRPADLGPQEARHERPV